MLEPHLASFLCTFVLGVHIIVSGSALFDVRLPTNLEIVENASCLHWFRAIDAIAKERPRRVHFGEDLIIICAIVAVALLCRMDEKYRHLQARTART